jgi:hypothetical protein
MVQVRPELARRDGALEVAVGGGDHARAHRDRPDATEPRKAKILQHLEQLRLERPGQLSDLVQVDRAAALMAEELGLEQALGNRRTVDLHEGEPATPVSPRNKTVASVSAMLSTTRRMTCIR